MYTLGFPFRPWAGRQGDRRRRRDPRLCRGDGARVRHRPAHPLRPPGDAARTGRRPRRAGRSRPRRGRRRSAHLRASSISAAAITITTRATGRDWPGEEIFAGRIVHPQFWPEDLDYAGKRVVVIGSGATAVTLVPALAETGGARDDAAALADLHRRAPVEDAHRRAGCSACCQPGRRRGDPLEERAARHASSSSARAEAAGEGAGDCCSRWVREQLPPATTSSRHFTPRYNPWDQRLCLVPDGDLFAAISDGKVSIVTGAIERFTRDRDRARRRARRSRPTSSSPPPA